MSNRDREFETMTLISQAMDAAMFGDYHQAIAYLTQAIQISPNNAEAYHNRGMAYARIQQWHNALADFGRSIALDRHPTGYEQRGLVHAQMGNSNAARQDWEEAVRLNPRRPLALALLGWYYNQARDYRKAIDYLSRAITAEPTYAKAYVTRAQAYRELGKLSQARADMQKARELMETRQDTSEQDLRD